VDSLREDLSCPVEPKRSHPSKPTQLAGESENSGGVGEKEECGENDDRLCLSVLHRLHTNGGYVHLRVGYLTNIGQIFENMVSLFQFQLDIPYSCHHVL
jgi:hypothetical protein